MTAQQHRIVTAVSESLHVPFDELFNTKRGIRASADARLILYVTLYSELGMTASQIARFVGRTPAAVWHGIRRYFDSSGDRGDRLSALRLRVMDALHDTRPSTPARPADEPDPEPAPTRAAVPAPPRPGR